MKRVDILRVVLRVAVETKGFIISNIGFTSRELYHIGDRDANFYMLGSMGMCGSIALGLAVSLPAKKIIAIEGDGSILMNLGSLATAANIAPANLTILIVDNEAHSSTGFQPTFTAGVTDLAAVAEGAGIKDVATVHDVNELESKLSDALRSDNLTLIVAKSEKSWEDVPVIDLDPVKIKNRFISALRADSEE
ncbi:MAG: sulfopyruvate decarboxylase subunit beta [Candidatus Hydrothermarchaeota archaeon]|uniref:sulfopyruvate decarboxylase n=1 Tax=Candidatus Syntropharchaeum caldarium TaxID=1838285 RepID=A0A1F2PAY7_9EURY|nr:MAG: sulfopyruvate decarboxylase beta subunit [Candidatus Syntrophoarchaeum caldarius]RLG54506.1 MAG: sulfopyruvate decarboxylase subunit beta [Candidatus Hydrothermarchaeota archaeon]